LSAVVRRRKTLGWADDGSDSKGDTRKKAIQIFRAGFIFGVGGSGTMAFAGNQYPVSVGGVSLGATIGVSDADLIGVAYHLHNASDIEGVYSAVVTGLSVAGGGSAAQLSNSRGVPASSSGKFVGKVLASSPDAGFQKAVWASIVSGAPQWMTPYHD